MCAEFMNETSEKDKQLEKVKSFKDTGIVLLPRE